MSISHDTRNPPKPWRWTASRIRKATPFPKPRGAIAAAQAKFVDDRRDYRERLLLHHFAQNADIVDAGEPPDDRECRTNFERFWIVVPVNQAQLDALAGVGAALAELEEDDDREPEHDNEEGAEGEMDIVAAEAFGSLRLCDHDARAMLFEVRDEQRAVYRQRTGREPYDREADRARCDAYHARWRAEIEAVPLHPNYKPDEASR